MRDGRGILVNYSILWSYIGIVEKEMETGVLNVVFGCGLPRCPQDTEQQYEGGDDSDERV